MNLPAFSPTAWQILAQLINQPDDQAHLRALSRLVGKSLRPVQLALEELEAARLLASFTEGNRRVFELNRRHPFYPGIRLLVRALRPPQLHRPLTGAMVKTIVAPILQASAIAEVEIVGSENDQLLPIAGPITIVVSPASAAAQASELEQKMYQKLRRKVKIIAKK